MKGKWNGTYTYTSKLMQRLMEDCVVHFQILIHVQEGTAFQGMVQDDFLSGGLEETGTIHGDLEGLNLDFTKQMPVRTVIFRDGSRHKLKGKHPPISYRGTLSPDKQFAHGIWEIKSGWRWTGLLPYYQWGAAGNWEMKRSEQQADTQ